MTMKMVVLQIQVQRTLLSSNKLQDQRSPGDNPRPSRQEVTVRKITQTHK